MNRLNPFRIAKNSFILIAGQFIVQFSAAVIGILVARFLGDEAYGRYSLAFVVAGTFGILFTLGVDNIIIREIARSPESGFKYLAMPSG